ncbi:cytochrome-c oxidase, cbb3-type subunit III [Sulfitobacter sp. S0837]|uniref:cytochrome-c oxidase, cbb3-type subunit III n=1 Tax=Sulfitobacter maritimus TaxID=2741719 RepID=UPI00158265BC|nr:cytochrome-c oxidase, cbb3-type subunit III [Sulfitobacter maritimus]NUH63972.1 cytochrome-c oxidase, cbb3-type subunit III [Sulfitobacter maritimus]
MSVKERDPLTGHETTGHEWDGITELNTRVPRAVWFFVAVTHVWALVYWVFMPSWPLINTYWKGLLNYDQAIVVEEKVAKAYRELDEWRAPLAALSAEEIREIPELMAHVERTAPTLFGDNCAACHGLDLAGAPGYPSLVDDAWLWGGDSETIMETLRVGINAPHPETRFAQMLAFGRDGMLSRPQIRTVVDYVQSLSGLERDLPAARLEEGATIFAENCASCHGENGQGIQEMGAPNLTDAAWVYGGDDETMFKTIYDGRQGWMPAWEDRLTKADRMMLTLYIQSRATEGQP